MKIVVVVARWIFVLAIPVLLITASLAAAFNSLWLYEWGFSRYDVVQTTGLDNTQLDKAARGLVDYFNSDQEYIDVTVIKDGASMALFNEREVIHLRDVKALVWFDYRLLIYTGVYCLAFAVLFGLIWNRDGRRNLARAVAWGGGVTLGLIAVFGFMVVVDFQDVFIQFHLLSFSNDMWLLDPATDYLIMLFPGGFWYDAVLVVIGMSVLMASLLVILGVTAQRCIWLNKIAAGQND